jgi:hypothetical protein
MNRWLASIGLGSCSSIAAAQQTIDRRLDASADGELEVANTAGEIVVEGWERNEVHVTGQLAENVDRLDVLADEQRVSVRVVLKPNRDQRGGDWWGAGTQLHVRAPRGMSLDVSAVSADVEIRGMRAEQRVASVSGDVETEAFAAEVRVQTVSGDLRVTGNTATGVIRANTVSGDVDVSNVAGEIWAESVSGDVSLRAGTIGRVHAKTVSGEISAAAQLDDASRLEGTAVSGDVDFAFTGSVAGDYRLDTFSGDIASCFGPQASNANGDRPPSGRQVRFREGNGTARVEATTHSGDISVCRQ